MAESPEVTPEGPTLITSTEARQRGIAWTIERADVIGIQGMADLRGVRRETFEGMISPTRRDKYKGMSDVPDQFYRGCYSSALAHLWLDPTWRPTTGQAGRIWAEHEVIVVPSAADVIGVPELADRLGITVKAVTSGISAGARTPRWGASLPPELLPDAKVVIWPRAAVDALRLDEVYA